MMSKRRRNPFVKVAVALAVFAGLGLLFWQTLDDSRAEPYTIREEHLAGWTIVSAPPGESWAPILLLQPPPELPLRVFRQIFTRAGETLSTPAVPGIALVLGGELAGAPGVSAGELAAMARDQGLEKITLEPACMAYRRDSRPGATRQLYFVTFDMPEFARFRQAVASRAPGFDPAALSPAMPIAAQPDFAGWLPIVADPAKDCVAPIVSQ